MKRRRSLTNVGGAVETAGDPALAATLARALDVAPAREPSGQGGSGGRDPGPDEPDRAHVHGFHTYPARMHPATAAGLVRALSERGAATLLDPFCGSGTVLVEAMIAGRRAVGVDLNPLAVRLAHIKTDPHDARSREAVSGTAQSIAAFADGRRERRAGATRRYPPEDVASFDPHVLLELDSLRAGIAQLGRGDSYVREALEMVLSSILVKVSRRTSDTSAAHAPRRIAAGFAARFFARKAAELARRLGDLAALVPPGTPPAAVALDDAARLRSVAASSVDAVVTSPPYASTYDYLAHHALRMRWLDLDARGLDAGEMGARRRYAALEPRAAREQWTRELAAALKALSRVCRKGASVALVLADSAVGGEALRADAVVASVAPDAGFALRARASQRRPHFHGPTVRAFRDAPRAEHAILLEKR
jgi:DNA modification methylase